MEENEEQTQEEILSAIYKMVVNLDKRLAGLEVSKIKGGKEKTQKTNVREVQTVSTVHFFRREKDTDYIYIGLIDKSDNSSAPVVKVKADIAKALGEQIMKAKQKQKIKLSDYELVNTDDLMAINQTLEGEPNWILAEC